MSELVNTYIHSPMMLMCELAKNMLLMKWLKEMAN